MQNTPDFKNDKYAKHAAQLNKVDNVFDGVDTAVKHLQQFLREEDKDYIGRQDVATLNNYVFRTIDSTKNIIFRQPVTVDELEGTFIEPYVDKIDFNQSIESFAKETTVNYVKDGKTYILVDSPVYGEEVKTKADEIANNLRPYFTLVSRARLINWQKDKQGNFTLVTIEEDYEESDGAFGINTGLQQRVIKDDGTIQIWRDGKQFGETIETGLDFVPLVEVGTEDIPPLYDLAKININHMNRNSELNNYVRVSSAPIPITYGSDTQEGAVTTIGVNDGLNFNGSKTECGFEWVETKGTNATVIREQLKIDEEAMVEVAVTLITTNKNKTATEVDAEVTEGISKLTDIAQTVEDGINTALSYMGVYSGTDITAKIKINRDYNTSKLSPQQVAEYRNDYTAGIISWETLIDKLIEGEIYNPLDEKEKLTEKAKIDDLGNSDVNDI